MPIEARQGNKMDVDTIRSRFIQENLRRAAHEQDRDRAIRVLSAFRVYYQWFESRIPDMEKFAILRQLAHLEETQAGANTGENSSQRTAIE
jgi:hypothetical protein